MYRKKRWLISYDISKDKIRTKVRKLLTKYGYRIQYSAYICEITPEQKKEVFKSISHLISKSDSVIWIPFSDQLVKIMETQGSIGLGITIAKPQIF